MTINPIPLIEYPFMEDQILIVDDDAAICDSLREFIEMFGFKSYTVYNAEDALDVLQQRDIQVVITDIVLPGMDGLELTHLIKKKFDADVIVMTGYSGDHCYEEAINRGASDFVLKPVRFHELLLRLKKVLKDRRLAQERIEMLKKLQELAITDGLTKLYNSRHFYNQLETEVDRCNRYKNSLSLILMDIDHFKRYNDTYGHLKGDKVLAKIGKIIKGCLRKNDSAYRYGGEEFTLILPETPIDGAFSVAQRIQKTVEKTIFEPIGGITVFVTISIGITEYIQEEDITTFIQRADQAMFTSKNNGRNLITSITPDGTVSV